MSKPNLDDLMKMAQDMQKKMKKLQKDLADYEVTGKAGDSETSAIVVLDGESHCKKVTISAGAYEAGVEIVEDLVAAAFNSAVKKVRDFSKDAMTEIYQQSGTPLGGSEESES